MSPAFSESIIEQAALDWLKAIGWETVFGPDIAPDMLAVLRDTLLPKLISGELRIKDLKKIIERCT